MADANLADLIRNATPSSFEPIPVGPYEVTAVAAEAKPTKKGDPMVVVEFVVDNGPHKGRKLWRNFALTANSVGIVVDQLGVLGVSQDALADAVTSGDWAGVCATIVDREAEVEVAHREWDNRIQNDVKKVRPRKGAAPFAPSAAASPAAAAGEAGRPTRPF